MLCALLKMDVQVHTSIGSASMSVRRAIFGVPRPTVATMPVLAYGCLKGMFSSLSLDLPKDSDT